MNNCYVTYRILKIKTKNKIDISFFYEQTYRLQVCLLYLRVSEPHDENHMSQALTKPFGNREYFFDSPLFAILDKFTLYCLKILPILTTSL